MTKDVRKNNISLAGILDCFGITVSKRLDGNRTVPNKILPTAYCDENAKVYNLHKEIVHEGDSEIDGEFVSQYNFYKGQIGNFVHDGNIRKSGQEAIPKIAQDIIDGIINGYVTEWTDKNGNKNRILYYDDMISKVKNLFSSYKGDRSVIIEKLNKVVDNIETFDIENLVMLKEDIKSKLNSDDEDLKVQAVFRAELVAIFSNNDHIDRLVDYFNSSKKYSAAVIATEESLDSDAIERVKAVIDLDEAETKADVKIEGVPDASPLVVPDDGECTEETVSKVEVNGHAVAEDWRVSLLERAIEQMNHSNKLPLNEANATWIKVRNHITLPDVDSHAYINLLRPQFVCADGHVIMITDISNVRVFHEYMLLIARGFADILECSSVNLKIFNSEGNSVIENRYEFPVEKTHKSIKDVPYVDTSRKTISKLADAYIDEIGNAKVFYQSYIRTIVISPGHDDEHIIVTTRTEMEVVNVSEDDYFETFNPRFVKNDGGYDTYNMTIIQDGKNLHEEIVAEFEQQHNSDIVGDFSAHYRDKKFKVVVPSNSVSHIVHETKYETHINLFFQARHIRIPSIRLLIAARFSDDFKKKHGKSYLFRNFFSPARDDMLDDEELQKVRISVEDGIRDCSYVISLSKNPTA